jgi:hypothetical protein
VNSAVTDVAGDAPPSRQNSISYLISSTRLQYSDLVENHDSTDLDVKTLYTIKRQIDDVMHPPRTAPVHWIEKRSVNSFRPRTCAIRAIQQQKRNAYVREWRDLHNLSELVRGKLSDQANTK